MKKLLTALPPRIRFITSLLFCCTFLLWSVQEVNAISAPTITFGMADANNPEEISNVLQIFVLLTVLSLVPGIILMTTCFVRIVIVLGFMRQAMGTQNMPPTQVVIGLALFLTFFVMSPVLDEINQKALQPLLTDLTMENPPKVQDDVPTTALIPAFMLSEIKRAFQMGFLIYVPFLVIDMIVASILMSMGMMMLPPVIISAPFKLLLFVLVDGWTLVVGSLIKSFNL